MTEADWEHVKCIFAAALELPLGEREAFVHRQCGNRLDQRDLLLDLLANHSSDSNSSHRSTCDWQPVLKVGELVTGRFRISRLIAAGGMGEVYEAWDEWLRLRVALKTVRPELLSDPGALDRFKRELLVARRVSHENVCRVFDFVEHRTEKGQQSEATPCFTMELLEGETLAHILERSRPLACADALAILKQVASGLRVLHNHGIVHRDLKPSNIIVVPQPARPDRVVVADFGLAKSEPGEVDWFQSATEFRGGAPYFTAPEVFSKSRPGIPSDVYSFGLLIDEMVTTSRAFSSTSPQALVWEKLWKKPLPPSSRSAELPPHWEVTILRCLEPEPSARFASIEDAVRSLELPPNASSTERTEGQPPRRIKRRLVLGVIIAAPVAGATAFTALALQPVSTSIEVYDIRNTTGLGEYDYFCRGTTAELTRQLLQLQRLRVFSPRISRTSARAATPARFSIDGMLQANNGQIRLTVQLSDNQQSGTVLWSDNFDRNGINDPLALQSDISRNTATAVERQLMLGAKGPDQANALARAAYGLRRWFGRQSTGYFSGPPTTSNIAFDFYMRGHHLLEELSPQSAGAAIDYFKRAIENDEQFALAYAGVADAYMALMNYNYAPHPELAQNARYYAERAVELGRDLAEAHAALAAVRQMDWDHIGAEDSYHEALRLKPNYAKARRWYAGFVLQFGRTEEAIRESRHALELDPYDPSAAPAVGLYLFFSGKYPEAIDLLQRSLQKSEMLMTRHNLGQVYAWLGNILLANQAEHFFGLALEQARAIENTERATSPDGKTSFSDQLFALAYALHGRELETEPYLTRLEADMLTGGTSPVTVGWIYAILRQQDKACDYLEKAASWRDRRLLYTKIIPFLTNLHGTPRFQALLTLMHLA